MCQVLEDASTSCRLSCNLFGSGNIFDLDTRIKVYPGLSDQTTVQVLTVSSGHKSHGRTPAIPVGWSCARVEETSSFQVWCCAKNFSVPVALTNLLCNTTDCFLQVQLTGTNVWRPKIHNSPPDVDLESFRSPANSVS